MSRNTSPHRPTRFPPPPVIFAPTGFQPVEEPLVPVDPFKASVAYGVKNIWSTTRPKDDLARKPNSWLSHRRPIIITQGSSRIPHIPMPVPSISISSVAPPVGAPLTATDDRSYTPSPVRPSVDRRSRSRSRPTTIRQASASSMAYSRLSSYHEGQSQNSSLSRSGSIPSPALSLDSRSRRPSPVRPIIIQQPMHIPTQVPAMVPVPIRPSIYASSHSSISKDEHQSTESYSTTQFFLAFMLDTCPRQIYLHLLLRLPYLYFSRVSRLLEEAEVSMDQLKRGILEDAKQRQERLPTRVMFDPPSAQYGNLENTWHAFIDSLLREWKTLNIISVLLLSAILTILQIDSAANDPITRFSALTSMICALMSLLYGCIYIIRFGTMRKTYKAAEWADESQQTRTGIFWNVWTLLAMPAVWLAWSMISYIICIMAFVWRSGALEDVDEHAFTRKQALAPRIVVSTVLCLGLIYLTLIASTLRRYGEIMDRAWRRRIMGWLADEAPAATGRYYAASSSPSPIPRNPVTVFPENFVPLPPQRRSSPPPRKASFDEDEKVDREISVRGRSPIVKSLKRSMDIPANARPTSGPPFRASSDDVSLPSKPRVTELVPVHLFPAIVVPNPSALEACHISYEDWIRLSDDLLAVSPVWDDFNTEPTLAVLKNWNDSYFSPYNERLRLGHDANGAFTVLHYSNARRPSPSQHKLENWEPPRRLDHDSTGSYAGSIDSEGHGHTENIDPS